MIRLALRAAFWLTAILLILPSDPDGGGPSVGVMELLSAARAAVADLSQFCVRNPELCATGEAAAQALADKARYAIEELQVYLDREAVAANTLRPDDVAAPWQGAPGAQVAAAP